MSDVYGDLNELLRTRHRPAESLRNFDPRFSTSISKFNANLESVSLTQSLTALILLSNDKFYSLQAIITLAAAAPSDHGLSSNNRKEDFIKLVKYESTASVLRKCDRDSTRCSTSTDLISTSSAITQSSALRHRAAHTKSNSHGKVKKTKILQHALANLKPRCTYKSCGMLVHW